MTGMRQCDYDRKRIRQYDLMKYLDDVKGFSRLRDTLWVNPRSKTTEY